MKRDAILKMLVMLLVGTILPLFGLYMAYVGFEQLRPGLGYAVVGLAVLLYTWKVSGKG